MSLLRVIKKIRAAVMLNLPDALAVSIQYRRVHGHWPDLKNPKKLTEKTQWRKLYQHNPRFVVFGDKIRAKEEYRKLIDEEYIVPTLWTGKKPEDIPFDLLTQPYVIKTSHSSRDIVFVHDDPATVNRSEIIEDFRKKLLFPYGLREREWAYSQMPRELIIEPILPTADGVVPVDYKCHVFDGKVQFIQLDRLRFVNRVNSLYDSNWNLLPVHNGFPDASRFAEKPANFQKMITLAETVAAEFDFARVDFFDSNGKLYIGETTFYPWSGLQPFIPESWDATFGAYWKIRKN